MRRVLIMVALIVGAAGSPAHATSYGGVEFPAGDASFADSVEAYEPVIKNGQPIARHREPINALNIPNYRDGNGTVSLGDGGVLTVGFVDNRLTGSGSSAVDLWVFEVGPDVEDTFVWVSAHGVTWHAVGLVGGGTAGVDLDAFGFDPGDAFRFVRLQDHPDRDGQTGDSVGADIDAVGAISTDLTPTAEADAYTTPAYETLTVAAPGVLANDHDPEEGPLTATLDASTTQGALQLAADGSFVYDPAAGFVGTDSFTYHATDLSGSSSQIVTVTIDVTGCGEDGLDALSGTPAKGGASRVVHEQVEPVVTDADEGLGALVHRTTCEHVVPAEDLVDDLTTP